MTIDDLELVPLTTPLEDVADDGLRACLPVVSCFLDFTGLL